MAETLTIRTAASTEVIKIAVPGPQGPAGAPGTGLETLTTQGDTLYRGASTGERLPIGTAGQVLKVVNGLPAWANESGAVSSVNGETGAVVLDGSEIDTSGNDASAAFIATSFGDGDGIYYPLPDSFINTKPVYRTTSGYSVFFENSRWHITDGSPVTANIIESSDNDNAAWPWLSAWSADVTKAKLSDVVGRARDTFLFVGDSIPNTSVSGLASVAASGDYDDLSGKPTIPTASSATPSALGTAAAGSSNDFARADHVHAMPSANDVGAADASHTHNVFTDISAALSEDPDAARAELNLGTAATANIGTGAGDVCAGNDARLSDSRTPTAHAASHASAGSDPVSISSSQVTDATSDNTPSTIVKRSSGGAVNVGTLNCDNFATPEVAGSSLSFDASGINFDGAAISNTRANLGLGTAATADIGTGSTEVAAGDHGHGNLTSDGKLGSVSGLPVVTTTAGAVTTLALGTANQVLRVNSGASGVEFADPAASGVTGAAASASDVLGVSGSDITGVDATADRLVFWDDSASKLTYLEAGSGLSISETTLTATASGGSKTYAVFTATDNQPPATAFATYDTRSSIAVLDFDAATDENAVFVGIMPEAASLGSGLIVRLHWMATTATSGNVRWGVQFERSNTDLDADSFAAAVEANGAANGTSGILTTTAITVTDFDGITAGDVFRLKVFRNADDATNDTMTGDAELVAVEIRSAA